MFLVFFFSSFSFSPSLVLFDLLGYLYQGSRCILCFFFVGSSSSLAQLTRLAAGAKDLPSACVLYSTSSSSSSSSHFFFNKLPLNKLENTHPGVIRRPQTLVICLPALPGKREQGKEGEEERRTARISSSSSSFPSLAWYSVRGEREKEGRRAGSLSHCQTTEGDLPFAKKKIPYIHIYLMWRENT